MPEELRNGRHLRNGSCAHFAQADRNPWTNPGTELLLPPAPGRWQRHWEVRGPLEEGHKSSCITGTNGFTCVRGQDIYLSNKPFRSMSLSERYWISRTFGPCPILAITLCRDNPFAPSAAWRAGPPRSVPRPTRELAARRCGHLRSLARA
jgi:hypothetical protein